MARILVIDDDNAVREATTMLLKGRGFDAVPAPDGKSGLDAIKAGGPFDLVIVDLFMPGMDGLETTRAIRQCDSSVPVIAVSGFMGNPHLQMPNFNAMATEAGALATLYKPFSPTLLFQAIREALGGSTPVAVAG